MPSRASIISVEQPGSLSASLVQDVHQKNPAAVALGKLGASKGGRARAAKLSREERRNIAKKAAQARWDKQ